MKLTKTMLTKIFEPKFNDLQNRLVEYGRPWVQEHHPVFVELLARKEARAKLSALGIPADASVL